MIFTWWFIVVGAVFLLMALSSSLLARLPLSTAMLYLGAGILIGPHALGLITIDPIHHAEGIERVTEVAVIISLFSAGLKLQVPRRDPLRRLPVILASWSMLLTVGLITLVGTLALGLPLGAAVLLGAVLAPTDPVLASDVQVAGPTASRDEDPEEVTEDDDVRFALTSEAGLNDGLAFPFVYAAIMAATMGAVTEWGLRWVAWELLGKIAIGVLIGTAVGWGLSRVAFSSPAPSLRLAEIGEPLLALAAVLLSYGIAEVAQGYGFLAVFACAMSMRSWERGHDYHAHMHESIERLERLLTLVVLLLLGVALTNGILENLGWPGVLVGLALVFVIRPLTGILALRIGYGRVESGKGSLDPRECWATAFFGVRGVGSLFYLAYAMGEADFGDHQQLWAIVAFTVTLSVLVHGIAATPVMKRLEAIAEERSRS